MNNAQESGLPPESFDTGRNYVVGIGRPGKKPEKSTPGRTRHKSVILQFIAEMRRRRVCRTATMYAVTMWLICQVVELIYPPLGLPDWTLKLVIMQGLLGFPVALVLSWMLEITPTGLVVDSSSASAEDTERGTESRRPFDLALDCSLLFVALVIGGQMMIGFLSAETKAAQPLAQKIAVLPFTIASGRSAASLSQGLVAELQRELAEQAHVTVIAPREQYVTDDSVSLAGSVAVGDTQVRVTAMIISNHTGVVTWSRAFERPRADAVAAPVRLAHDIVAALPVPFPRSKVEDADNAP